ncbi:MAG: hypothetical protein V4508_15640 [Pseudomonadota bacterium]
MSYFPKRRCAGRRLVSGRASFAPDGGCGAVQSLTSERTGAPTDWIKSDADATAVVTRVAALLGSDPSAR